MNKVKTMFIGSGDFAVPILDSLLKNELVDLVCVVTQPDKPVGRKQVLTATPVGEFLQKNSIKLEVAKPAKIRLESDALLAQYQPELIIVASYGQIIPESLLNYPIYKALNLHGSLLPELRGAVPVQMAILNGFNKTGVTIQRMVYEMDAGPIVAVETVNLEGTETTDMLMDRLANIGAELLTKTLPDWVNGNIEEQAQDETTASYCYKSDLEKVKAEITFETDINLAERMIRAYFPWPVAWVNFNNKMIKIFSAVKSDLSETSDSIKFIKRDRKLYLVLKTGCLEVLELQEEGKTRGEYRNYLYLAN